MTTPKELAHFMTVHIALSGRTQREIAEGGRPREPELLVDVEDRHGEVPLRRVPALAAALGVHPIDLMFMCLRAQDPELAEILAMILPELPNTEDEVMLMRAYRILREKEIIDDNGVDLRGRGPKGRACGWASISKERRLCIRFSFAAYNAHSER